MSLLIEKQKTFNIFWEHIVLRITIDDEFFLFCNFVKNKFDFSF